MQLKMVMRLVCLSQIPVCLGLHAAQRQDAARQFVLVSGSEGSGTTLVARILSECETCVGIPTNQESGWVSLHARRKLESVGDLTGMLRWNTRSLWADSSRSYINDGVDARDPKDRLSGRREASEILEEILDRTNLSTVVYHRSMPFEIGRAHTPFLEDLPFLLPNGLVHVVVVNRFQPASWLSHADPNDYAPFLARIEALMAGRETVPGVNVHFVSYEQLLCEPRAVLGDVANKLRGVNVEDLLSSPALRDTEGVAHRHDQDQEYLMKFEQYKHKWENEKDQYPAFEHFQQAGQSQCEDPVKLRAIHFRQED